MRKLFLFTLSLISVIFVSCGKNKAEQELNHLKDSLAHVDSIHKADSLAKADSLVWMTFSSQDLKTFGLVGHVKEVIQNGDANIRLQFDTNGKLTFCSIGEERKIDRNHKGQIVNLPYKKVEEIGWRIPIEFTYNDNGMPKTKFSTCDMYQDKWFFDEKGWEVKGTSYWPGSESTNTSTYSYTKTDSFGNWIQRTVSSKEKKMEYDDYDNEVPKVTSTSKKEKRTITYYEKK